jgi:hypothetical protein
MAAFYILVFNNLMYSIKKNKIYHKMQREKFYNLQKTIYFMLSLFVFKIDAILSDQISTQKKK